MPSFIIENLEEIIDEWETFARTLSPASDTMDSTALRDHARQMLEAIAEDVETSQSRAEQALKSKGMTPVSGAVETAAAAHGALRHTVGFDLAQVAAEFRAMRATVLRIWVAKKRYGDPDSVYAMTRFNESVDQALAESMDSYSRELSASRDTFLAILGHDLRSPLSALSGALHILSKSSTDAQRAQALAIGMRSVSAMSAMIRDLLEYTRTRLGKGIPIDPAPGNLETVCREAIAEISLAYRETEFLFESRGLLDGTFDSERIHQVVSNLLNNAVQYGQQGLPVSLGAFRDNGSLVLQVTNHGLPIPPDQLQVIFDPLVQIHAEGSELHRSTNLGLGLFIAREIVLAHRGTIEAASSAEEGTTFTVELPCAARVPYAPAR